MQEGDGFAVVHILQDSIRTGSERFIDVRRRFSFCGGRMSRSVNAMIVFCLGMRRVWNIYSEH